MPGLQRDITETTERVNGTANRADSPNGIHPTETLDAVVLGAGFAGVYILHKLRKAGFNSKIIEAGAGLGGIWWWNAYPGARVDSQYPIYALSLPEVYEDWNWSSHYPDHVELRAYFEHIDKKLHIKKDTVFNNKVVRAVFHEEEDLWHLECDTGRSFRARHFLCCIGFAGYFPDWEGLDTFKGEIHHSSFWPHEGIDVRGKRCAVVGTGATGVQITQEWAREVGEDGSLKMFQRTPNLACPMNQVFLTEEQQRRDKERYPELFNQRWLNYNGFLYQYRPEMMFDFSEEERKALFDELWRMGGFRFLMNNYYDMTRELKANRIAYDYWHDRIHERVHDPRKAELLAPKEPSHPFGANRLSLEQDFYDHFNKPNVDVIDVRSNPIVAFEPRGIRRQDGTVHELDVIALATGFDSITGGIKDIDIRGLDGEKLADKWKDGTYTYLGMTTARFPNFYFTYGPQGPTAFSNGPSCNGLQGDWIVTLLERMREKRQTRIDPKVEEEQRWKSMVNELALKGVRGHTDSWYNGANIPGMTSNLGNVDHTDHIGSIGKPREPLNYAGGIPVYIKEIGRERDNGYPGFNLQ